MANHLIIGLGGTGGKILRAFRKTLYQEFRGAKPSGVHLGYLYVDSSSEMMDIDDPTWKILGTSVQLGIDSQLSIKGSDLETRLENIQNYPNIRPWIGMRVQWNDILRSFSGGATLGGQKRRLGRFLFACNAQDFLKLLKIQVAELRNQSNEADITFHICTGLAGGTGSGSIIDTLCQIRKIFPYTSAPNPSLPDQFRVLVYVGLPDTLPLPNWDTGNYHANGYAALTELNALGVGKLEPHDISGDGDRLKLVTPFNGCYLFLNENENGIEVDTDKELPGILADFLYQKIVAIRAVPWESLRRAENGENGDSTPETAPIPGSREGAREKKFLAFGVKRIVIPEEEIGEYLTYNFARQANLQLLFNNWSATAGFLDEPSNQAFREFVEKKETQAQWKLSNEHLTLSLGILSEEIADKKWKPVNTDWENVIPHFKTDIRSGNKKTWLDELSKLCEKRFEHDFRGLGVANFYKAKRSDVKDQAREIRRTVEGALFTDWMNGVDGRSLTDISRLLSTLINSLDDRLKQIPDRIEKLRGNEREAAGKVNANSQEWTKIGVLSDLLGKADKLLDAQALCLQALYIHRTWIDAFAYAQRLLQEVIVEMNDLKAEVDRSASSLASTLKYFDDGIAARCIDDGKANLGKQVVRFYDPDLVRRTSKALVLDENEQRAQIGKVRKRLVEKVGEQLSFSRFNQRLGKSSFIDLLESECAVNAQVAHNNLITDSKKKLLGVSIVEKLKERYGGDPLELRKFVAEVVRHACNYLSFDPHEVDKHGVGIPEAPTRVQNFAVTLPKSPEHAKFLEELKAAFKASRQGHLEFLERDGKANEIVLTSVTNLFPLRFVKQVGFLRQKYEPKLKGPNAERARLELHIEGDGSQYPPLFVPSSEDVKRDGLPYVLLAKQLDLIQLVANAVSGTKQLAIMQKDEYGVVQPIYLGKTFTESFEKLDLERVNKINSEVKALLKTNEYLHEEKREELRKKILADLETIRLERDGNWEDPIYKRFVDAGKSAIRILKEEQA